MLRRPANAAILLALLAAVAGLIGASDGVPASAPPVALAAVAGTGVTALPADAGLERLPDPFPIRRVLVPAERLAAVVDLTDGSLRRISRADFENQVRTAARAVAASAAPRLIEARYRATVTDAGLAGSGEWAVVNPGRAAALPLDPLRVAIGPARGSDKHEVLVYRPFVGPAAPTLLWVEPTARRTIAFDWSARGVEEPGELRFDLRLPAVPLTLLELDLPAGQSLVATQADILVSGPLPSEDDERSVWRVSFGGRDRVEFAVRGAAQAGLLPPFARARHTARFEVSPGLVEARFEFDLEAVRSPTDLWEFAVDPALRVIDAAVTDRESWRFVPGEAGKPGRLSVHLREPAAGARIVVTAVASFPADGAAWPCPMVRPSTASVGAESIDLRFSADMQIDGWDDGDYRTIQAAAGPDQSYTVSLGGTLSATGAAVRRPPVLRARGATPAFASSEEIEWQVEPGRSRLTGRFRVRVLRGPLTQIAFRLPPGFTPEPGLPILDDPASSASAGPGGSWVVEPSRPLAAGQTVEVQLALRGPPAPPAGDPAALTAAPASPIPFPRLIPITAGPREGTYTVSAGSAYRAWSAPPPDPASRALAYTYSGREPDGSLVLVPRPSRVTLQSETTVSLDAANRLTATTRLRPRAERGEIGTLTLLTPDAGREAWVWSVAAAGAEVQPYTVGPQDAIHAAFGGLTPVDGNGRLWRVRLARPLSDGVEITLSATAAIPTAGPVKLPMPVVLGAVSSGWPIVMNPLAAARFDAPAATDPRETRPIPTIELLPRGTAPATDEGRDWQFADVRHQTRLDASGNAFGVLTGALTATGGAALPVVLPRGAVVESATIAGKWAHPTRDGERVWIPVPALALSEENPGRLSFELRYRLADPVNEMIGSLTSPTPVLPDESVTIRRDWAAGPRYRLWPSLAATADSEGIPQTRVIDARLPALFGYVAAAALAGWGVIWLIGRPPRRRHWAVLTGLTASIGAAAWLAPDAWQPVLYPPLVVALAVTVIGVARRVRRREAVPAFPAGNKPSVLVPLTAACVVLVWMARVIVADDPAPAVVYLVAGPGPAAETVFLPQTVLDRLAAVSTPALPAVVLASAEYTGREAENTASFEAHYHVQSTRDGEHLLVLPLTGIRLESLQLDGSAAFPDARPDHIAVPIRGKGRHNLVARFTVPVNASSADRELRFGIPDVPATRLTLTLPATARQVVVPQRRGDLRVTNRSGATQVRADLGSGRVVAMQWRVGEPAAGRQLVRVSEFCVWDLDEDDATATATFLYQVEPGSLARVRFELPAGCEPGRVAVRAIDAVASGPANGVKSWALEASPGGGSLFTVVFQTPIEGRVAVTFKLSSRNPSTTRPALRIPRALDATTTESYVGVRLAGVSADGWDKTGLIDFPAAKLAQEFAAVGELDLGKWALTRAFRREGPAAPLLQLTLRPQADPRPLTHELTWQLGPRGEVAGTVRWAKDATVARAEFDIPGSVAVTDVRSNNLAGWSRSGTRVRVWFRSAAREPIIRWVGSLNGYPIFANKPPADPATIELPFPPPGSEKVTAQVRPADGWMVVMPPSGGRVEGGRDLILTPAPKAPTRVFLYPPRSDLTAFVWQTAEPANGGVAWRAAIELPIAAKRPQTFTIWVGDLPTGSEAKLEMPAGIAVVESAATGESRAWTVTVPAQAASTVRAAVAVRLPRAESVALPSVEVRVAAVPVNRTNRQLALSPEYRLLDRVGAREATGLGDGSPAEAVRIRQRGGTIWQIGAAEPIRVMETQPVEAAFPHPPRPPRETHLNSTQPAGLQINPDAGRWLAAAAWVLAFGLVVSLAVRGPWRVGPELLVALGVVAAVAAGPGFLAVALFGGLLRLSWFARRFGRLAFR